MRENQKGSEVKEGVVLNRVGEIKSSLGIKIERVMNRLTWSNIVFIVIASLMAVSFAREFIAWRLFNQNISTIRKTIDHTEQNIVKARKGFEKTDKKLRDMGNKWEKMKWS